MSDQTLIGRNEAIARVMAWKNQTSTDKAGVDRTIGTNNRGFIDRGREYHANGDVVGQLNSSYMTDSNHKQNLRDQQRRAVSFREYHMEGNPVGTPVAKLQHRKQSKPQSCSVATTTAIRESFGQPPIAEPKMTKEINKRALERHGGTFDLGVRGKGMPIPNALHTYDIGAYDSPDPISQAAIDKIEKRGDIPFLIAQQKGKSSKHVSPIRSTSPQRNKKTRQLEPALEYIDTLRKSSGKVPLEHLQSGNFKSGYVDFDNPTLHGARYPRKSDRQIPKENSSSPESLGSGNEGMTRTQPKITGKRKK